MPSTEVVFRIDPPSPGSEIMMAHLSEIGYDSFEETGLGLKAYIDSGKFDRSSIDQIVSEQAAGFDISFSFSELPDKNWNEVWESNFQPVLVKDTVYVRAPFHKQKNIKYQIIIEPKMSFGTGHHETTSLMMEMMLDEDLSGRKVLDVGCGTGILSIFAEILGAAEVTAIDNDKNAFENAVDNVRRNKCKIVGVHYGDIRISTGNFDFILANINRNVLLADIENYSDRLTENGVLLVSGFYQSDLDEVRQEASKAVLQFERSLQKNSWVAAKFKKK